MYVVSWLYTYTCSMILFMISTVTFYGFEFILIIDVYTCNLNYSWDIDPSCGFEFILLNSDCRYTYILCNLNSLMWCYDCKCIHILNPTINLVMGHWFFYGFETLISCFVITQLYVPAIWICPQLHLYDIASSIAFNSHGYISILCICIHNLGVKL